MTRHRERRLDDHGRRGRPRRGQGRAPALRYQRREPGPDLRLPSRRQGQLRGRPGGRRRGAQGRPGDGLRRPGEPGVPRPGRPLPRRGGRDPAVPRHRHRHPDGRQHPPGRPGRRAAVPGGLRGLRPDRARPRARPADQQPGRRYRVHRRRPARHWQDPRPGLGAAGLHQAGGGDAAAGPARDTGLRRPLGAGGQGDGRPAAGQLPRRVPPGVGSPRPGSEAGLRGHREPLGPAAVHRPQPRAGGAVLRGHGPGGARARAGRGMAPRP
jgi:hypothetical protein